MIKANELRIGNWVQHNANWCFRSPEKLQPFTFRWNDNDWFALGECTMSLSDCDGIPLSPEILEKCGFERKVGFAEGIGEFDWHDNGVFETVHQYKNWITLKGVESIPVKYLHQLQNLYFALTGEELEVKGI